MTECLAIIAAGGSGQRMGGNVPKQFMEINGKPIIAHTIETFENSLHIKCIIVVAPEEYINVVWRIVKCYSYEKVIAVIAGGRTRQESVYNALLFAEASMPGKVLVHDAARPFVELNDIEAIVKGVDEAGCAVPVVSVKDTIKVLDEMGEVSTLDRASIYAVQTPQGFNFKLLLESHKKAITDGFEGYDDSVLTERMGLKTKLINSGYHNMKITTKEDLWLAEKLLLQKKER